MFHDQETAAEISALMLGIGKKLDASLAAVRQSCPEPEFEAYRLAVGKIMGEILLEVLNPIYTTHPALKPQELD